jgi:small subunit ribosomal protein S1
VLVKVVEVERNRNRVIVSERAAAKELRSLMMNKLIATIEPGRVIHGIVTTIKDFGVFVDLGGADGMIHVSELSHDSISHPSEVVRRSQSVMVKVLSVDKERRRIELSLKAMQGDAFVL